MGIELDPVLSANDRVGLANKYCGASHLPDRQRCLTAVCTTLRRTATVDDESSGAASSGEILLPRVV